MNPLARFLLRAKHWQIFLLLVIPMILATLIMLFQYRSTLYLPEEIRTYGIAVALLLILRLWAHLAWLWATGEFLNSATSPALKIKSALFRLSLIFTAVYYTLHSMARYGFDSNSNFYFLALGTFALFCGFYLLFSVSKSLVLAETGKRASFLDYAGPFLRMWFLEIGIWTIQPRINELYEKSLSPAMEIRPESQ